MIKFNGWKYDLSWCDAAISNMRADTLAFKVRKEIRNDDKEYVILDTVLGGPNAVSQEISLPLDLPTVDYLIKRLSEVKQSIIDSKK